MDEPLLQTRPACPVCATTAYDRVLDLPFDSPPLDAYLRTFYEGRLDPARLADHRYVLDRCSGCGVRYQREVPGPAFLEELYDDLARGDGEDVSRRRGLPTRQAYAYDVEQLVKHWNRSPAEIRVLDYGSGFGDWLRMAAAYGCGVAAAELSPRKAAALAGTGTDVLPVDDLPSDRFHFINTEQVFEHLIEPGDTVRRLARSLVPGGLLRISVPNGRGIDAALATPDWQLPKGDPASLNAIAPLEHVNCWEHESLTALGRIGGLDVFRYPLRQFLDPMERIRHVGGAVLHRVRPPRGTLVLFRRPPTG